MTKRWWQGKASCARDKVVFISVSLKFQEIRRAGLSDEVNKRNLLFQ